MSRIQLGFHLNTWLLDNSPQKNTGFSEQIFVTFSHLIPLFPAFLSNFMDFPRFFPAIWWIFPTFPSNLMDFPWFPQVFPQVFYGSTAEVLPQGVAWRRLDASEALQLQRRQGRLLLTDRDRLLGKGRGLRKSPFSSGICRGLPSGKLTVRYGKIHYFIAG